MARDSVEYDVGGELRDKYGRVQYVLTQKHLAPLSTDTTRAYTPTDADGRQQIVIQDASGSDLAVSAVRAPSGSSAHVPDFWLPPPSGDTTGATDNAAIQAVINAASGGNFSARVLAQSSPLAPYYFTNLTIPKGVSLEGGGPFGARLVRAVGATGTAIVDTGVNGATGISLRRLFIDGNGTAGNGIDLGNQSGKPDWNSFAVIEDMVVENFTSGIGYNLNPDAVTCRNISAVANDQGIVTTGHGQNNWFGVFLVGNATNDLVLASAGENIFGLHIEPVATTSVQINSGDCHIYGLSVFLQGNITNLISVASGITGVSIAGVNMALNGHICTNLINPASWGNLIVPGSVLHLQEWTYSGNNNVILADSANGSQVVFCNGQNIKQYRPGLAYSASITPNVGKGPWQVITVTNGTAFTINAPTNPPDSLSTTELVIEVFNNSGGAMGTITWNGAFEFAGFTWANPATSKKRYVCFNWNGGAWIATSMSSADYS